MSRHSAAALSASSCWPSLSLVCTSPDGQPVDAIRPPAYSLMSSLSGRAHLVSQPSANDRDEILKRLRRPSLFWAQIVLCT